MESEGENGAFLFYLQAGTVFRPSPPLMVCDLSFHLLNTQIRESHQNTWASQKSVTVCFFKPMGLMWEKCRFTSSLFFSDYLTSTLGTMFSKYLILNNQIYENQCVIPVVGHTYFSNALAVNFFLQGIDQNISTGYVTFYNFLNYYHLNLSNSSQSQTEALHFSKRVITSIIS